MERVVALAGFPTDANSSYRRGPAKAPAAIRSAMWSEAGNPYAENGTRLQPSRNVADLGDVELCEDSGDRERIESAVAAQLDLGRRVLSLGGDHSITYPIVSAYAKRYDDLQIVHVDAHPDLYAECSGNRYSHACPFARILEDTTVDSLVQIGIRTMTPPQREFAQRYGVNVYGPGDVEQACLALPNGTVYVTIDLDGLDPAFAPGVSHREPGGLSVRDVLRIIAAIPGRIVGADVVELNPDCDVDGLTAGVAAKLARELAAVMIGGR
ncbi:MAG: agmatinase [Candidatus Eremiobacteraeota bacterium]|nr:agmatinase [Candidatus Eremiobacteraeota bacterium]